MDKLEMLAWFGPLAESEKIFVLRDIYHHLMVALKDIYIKANAEESLRASCSVSEINDLIARKLGAILAMDATCPDDLVIETLIRNFLRPELRTFTWHAWHSAVRAASERKARKASGYIAPIDLAGRA